MILDLTEVKEFLRLEWDFQDENTTIQTLTAAAEAYLANATGKQFDSSNALAKLFCLVLVADWYEDRTLVGRVGEKVRLTIDSILAQLTYCSAPAATGGGIDGT